MLWAILRVTGFASMKAAFSGPLGLGAIFGHDRRTSTSRTCMDYTTTGSAQSADAYYASTRNLAAGATSESTSRTQMGLWTIPSMPVRSAAICWKWPHWVKFSWLQSSAHQVKRRLCRGDA
ncbi:hypothetical protein GCM10010308_51340 [Streptomyces vinaceusdrappus]|nr:hypothetical protein GCM10010301_53200 [Streptomyces plicatus]GHC27969.1 hypothetical protein GCM10010308_51340 [Streptomyces vinaceusdrappus]